MVLPSTGQAAAHQLRRPEADDSTPPARTLNGPEQADASAEVQAQAVRTVEAARLTLPSSGGDAARREQVRRAEAVSSGPPEQAIEVPALGPAREDARAPALQVAAAACLAFPTAGGESTQRGEGPAGQCRGEAAALRTRPGEERTGPRRRPRRGSHSGPEWHGHRGTSSTAGRCTASTKARCSTRTGGERPGGGASAGSFSRARLPRWQPTAGGPGRSASAGHAAPRRLQGGECG